MESACSGLATPKRKCPGTRPSSRLSAAPARSGVCPFGLFGLSTALPGTWWPPTAWFRVRALAVLVMAPIGLHPTPFPWCTRSIYRFPIHRTSRPASVTAMRTSSSLDSTLYIISVLRCCATPSMESIPSPECMRRDYFYPARMILSEPALVWYPGHGPWYRHKSLQPGGEMFASACGAIQDPGLRCSRSGFRSKGLFIHTAYSLVLLVCSNLAQALA